jgi:hypothetical protein
VSPRWFFRLAFVAACLSLVAGCGEKPRIRTVVRTIEVPKPVFCKPAPVPKPVYPIETARGDEDVFELAQLYAATVKVMLGEITGLRAANSGAVCPE